MVLIDDPKNHIKSKKSFHKLLKIISKKIRSRTKIEFLKFSVMISLPLVGLEPTRQKTPVPKTGTSTIPSQRLLFSVSIS